MNILCLAIVLTAAAPSFEVQSLDGQTLVGPVTACTAERLTVQTSDGSVDVPIEKLAGLAQKQKSATPAKTPGASVELLDGSILSIRQYVCQKGQAKVTLLDGQTLDVPTNSVGVVRLQRESESLTAEWSRLLKMKRDADLLVIRKDDNIDYHKGVLQDVTENLVSFDLDGDVLPVKREKVFGFAYHHRTEDRLPPAACRITDAAGSLWSAREVTLADDQWKWTTPAGLSVTQPVEKIVQIDFSSGKIVYLSDLNPDSVAWTPFFGAAKPQPSLEKFYAPRNDRNFEAAPLQLGGTQYRKGLALHSRTELVYRLPEGFSRLRALAGIDDAVRPNGKVRLVIRGDDKVLIETSIAGNDPPKSIDLDIAGVRRVTILVDFGDSLNVGDHLLLCNARISK